MANVQIRSEPLFPRLLNEDMVVNGAIPRTRHGIHMEAGITNLWGHGHQYPAVQVSEEGAPAVITAADTHYVTFQLMPYVKAIEFWFIADGAKGNPLIMRVAVTGAGFPSVDTDEFYGSEDNPLGGNHTSEDFGWQMLLLEGFGTNSGKAEVTTSGQDHLISITNQSAAAGNGSNNIHLYAYKLRMVHTALLEQDH